MKLSGWGQFPSQEAELVTPDSIIELQNLVASSDSLTPITPRGLGRSYGDSAIGVRVSSSLAFNRLISFDENSGLLTAQAGVSFAELLRVFLPRGWFLPVTPGTKYITLGGAVAANVHGKNHHLQGAFGNFVTELQIVTGTGELLTASRTDNPELFKATLGGMGLTGVIVSVTLQLFRVGSAAISERRVKAQSLDELFELFEQNQNSSYSVAWIDCLSTGKRLGRSVLSLGEAIDPATNSHQLSKLKLKSPVKTNKQLPIPFNLPGFALNPVTVKIFNQLYYYRDFGKDTLRVSSYDEYFYPLDSLKDWFRLYGKSGFLQYQFVLPTETGRIGLETILKKIVASSLAAPLAVLKTMRAEDFASELSFPQAGYTLAVDFQLTQRTFNLLEELDRLVLEFGGRLYLAKDSRMTKEVFRSSYPQWEQFQELRANYSALGKFSSAQSKRLGLD